MPVTATYHPDVFNAADLASARVIILTPDGVNTTDDRWKKETPYLLELMAPLNITEESIVLDYGCGVGRLSKAFIEKFNCLVVGVDISANMRALARDYVASPRFRTFEPGDLPRVGIKFDAAIAVWVLQHCLAPATDIEIIAKSLKPNAPFFVVNEVMRFVPAKEAPWIDDGKDIAELIGAEFAIKERGPLDLAVVPAAINGAYWMQCSNGRE